jgi:hypothetical protein
LISAYTIVLENYFSIVNKKCNYFQRNNIIIVNIFKVIASFECPINDPPIALTKIETVDGVD